MSSSDEKSNINTVETLRKFQALMQWYSQFIDHISDPDGIVSKIKQIEESPSIKGLNAIAKFYSALSPGMVNNINRVKAAEDLHQTKTLADEITSSMLSQVKGEKTDQLEKNLKETNATATKLEAELYEQSTFTDASGNLTGYLFACSNAQSSSQLLENIASDLGKVETNTELESDIWNKIRKFWSLLKEKVSSIMDKIKGSVLAIGSEIIAGLGELEDAISKGRDKVAELFKNIANRFYDFVNEILERMFDFVNQFSVLAKKKGFGLKSIEVKLPSIDIKFVNVLTIPVPIPKMNPPDVTVTFAPS